MTKPMLVCSPTVALLPRYGLNQTTLGDGPGSGPGSVGGLKANLSPELLAIATELANDEINHVSSASACNISN